MTQLHVHIANNIINGNRADARAALRDNDDPAQMTAHVINYLAKTQGYQRAVKDVRMLLSVP